MPLVEVCVTVIVTQKAVGEEEGSGGGHEGRKYRKRVRHVFCCFFKQMTDDLTDFPFQDCGERKREREQLR